MENATIGAAAVMLLNDADQIVSLYKSARDFEISVRGAIARGARATPK